MNPVKLSGFFKRGSTWRFSLIRKDSAGAAIDLTGQTVRAIFRTISVDGDVLLTMDGTNGLTIPTPANGTMQFVLSPDQTVLFPVGIRVYFDVELTAVDLSIWQSPTYYIVAEQEVTR